MESPHRKTCFVVMGFGQKTDFRQQKTFNLDKTYKNIIRPAVEAAGLECIRADDIIHAGTIDKPMYEQLFKADIVIADLSTSNENAIYELGVRHGLRPRTTIVLAEAGFKFPFDLNSVIIRTYEHMGDGIDFDEVERMRASIREAVVTLVDDSDDDSPVYTFLPWLKPPSTGEAETGDSGQTQRMPIDQRMPIESLKRYFGAFRKADVETNRPNDVSFSFVMEMFREARAAENWPSALMALEKLQAMRPNDPFILQQSALATYKGKQPDVPASLANAKEILAELNPDRSNDPETLGLWGAIHKRLWETAGERDDLDEAIRSYGKGFYLRDDYYNGINYAYMLDVRAAQSSQDDAVADRVWAKRIRRRVVQLAERQLQLGVHDEEGNPNAHELFWLRATLVEAYAGSDQKALADEVRQTALGEAPEGWMAQTLDDQLAKLAGLQGSGLQAG